MSTPAPLAAVVLAGGASRRMGRDKATLAHPDSPTTMVEHTVDVLRARCSPIFVIAAPGQALPPLQAEVLRDEIRGVGPLLATGRGLRPRRPRDWIARSSAPWTCRTCPSRSSRRSSTTTGVDIVLPWDGRDHYLAGIYRTDLADRIEALVSAGERSMRALADTVVTQRVVVPFNRELANVNSPDDLNQQILR